MDLEAGVRIGDFEIERRLGAGGMGIVTAQRQLSLKPVGRPEDPRPGHGP